MSYQNIVMQIIKDTKKELNDKSDLLSIEIL